MGTIRYAQLSDLPAIARCHRKAFPDSLSSRLGQRYCIKMLQWYLQGPEQFLFYIEENGACIGYAGGFVKGKNRIMGSASSMTQYTMKAAMLAFLTHPWLIFTSEATGNFGFIWENIKRKLGLIKPPVKKEKPKSDVPKPLSVGLVVIGADPAWQGKGVGSQLLQEFERKSREMGLGQMHLSVKPDNKKAIASYARNGWIELKTDDKLMYMGKKLG